MISLEYNEKNETYSLKNPLRVYYDINYDCNLSCDYCYNKDRKNEREKYLNSEEKIEMLNNLKSLGVEKISIAGGEPFLSKDLFFFVEEAFKRGFKVSMTTNGTLIGDQEIEFLKKGFLKRITISIDGINENDNLKRKDMKMEKILSSIERIKNETSADLSVKSVISLESEIVVLEDLVKYAIKKEIKTIKFVFLRKKAYIENKNHEQSYKYYELLYGLKKIKEKYKAINIKVPSSVLDNNFGLANELLGTGCAAGKDLLYINPYGEIKPCVMLEDRFSVGNIRGNDLSLAWNKLKSIMKPKNKKCENCTYLPSCYGGCISRKIDAYSDFNKTDIFCYKEFEQHSGKYSKIVQENLKNVRGNKSYCLSHL